MVVATLIFKGINNIICLINKWNCQELGIWQTNPPKRINVWGIFAFHASWTQLRYLKAGHRSLTFKKELGA
jgi:hypothetical protein